MAPWRGTEALFDSAQGYRWQTHLAEGLHVASQCGNTPQYAKLQALSDQYKEKGLVVLGFPCNDFGEQEPGSNAEIKSYCSTKYAVNFPLFDKLHVKGSEQHPLYAELTGPAAPFPGPVKWNFGKFLVGRDGKVLKRFEPAVQPDSPEVTSAIDSALAGK
ncbi:MAG: glutathione peroxidase [Verrucomicrobiota bacterium]